MNGIRDNTQKILEGLRSEDNCNVLDYIDDAVELIHALIAERNAAVSDLYEAASVDGSFCGICAFKDVAACCERRKANMLNCWQWRGEKEKPNEHH